MHTIPIPILGFAAPSGTGKTTLLTQILPELKRQGLQVAIIKHSHHNFEIDHPGKDSYRLRSAGASPVLLVSKYRRVVITEFSEQQEPNLAEQLAVLDQTNLDLILVEGFRHEGFPKIELHRDNLNKSMLYLTDPHIIAIASDIMHELPPHITLLNINDPTNCVDFILHYIAHYKNSLLL